jgi:hypothetical protein
MKKLVDGYALVLFLFFGAGYLLSQLQYQRGLAAQHAFQMDQPPIRMLATVLFVLAIALAFIREPKPEEPTA